jgi:regulator of sirC expression with transglutaminase-like and TPR domain
VDDVAAGALLKRALGDGAELHPALFAAASARATLVRLLTNLQSTYAKRGEHARAFIAVDRIVMLVPDSARMLRERGALAVRIGAIEVARADFARVIALEPHAPDVPQLEARLANLVPPPRSTLH